jgi:thiopeptide-type bacteriocin biosynthesis protein
VLGKSTKQALGDRFRGERRRLETQFWRTQPLGPELDRAWRALERRSRRLSSVAARLNALERAGALYTGIPELLGSYSHMHVNRMIRAAATSHEPILYDFLFRLYDSRIASERRATRTAVVAVAADVQGAEL